MHLVVELNYFWMYPLLELSHLQNFQKYNVMQSSAVRFFFSFKGACLTMSKITPMKRKPSFFHISSINNHIIVCLSAFLNLSNGFCLWFWNRKSLGFLARKTDSFICNGLRFLSFVNILFFIIELLAMQINIFDFYYLY